MPQLTLLADSLEALRLQSRALGSLELRAPWGIRVNGGAGWIHLLSQSCFVTIRGTEPLEPAAAGDLLIIFPGHEHDLLDSAASPSIPMEQLAGSFRHEIPAQSPPAAHAPAACLACICFTLDGLERTVLHAALPAMILLRGDGQRARPCVEQLLRLILEEAASSEPCAQSIINRLVGVLLIKAVQDYMGTAGAAGGNWLRAIGDPEIGRAIALMHDQPETHWTVASLAAQVALSRSAFSAHFTALMGKPPLEYLFEWRMLKAAHLLRTSFEELKEVAARVGYESASAFSKAFTRWAGTAPSTYREAMRTQAAAPTTPRI